ncbi:hypothetical protein EZ313_02890 [Ramlibacter henchirensis]|uniref:DUF2214 family protein n=1 Tax=Ramlibacter henchirensis TaxID=204072 RepID=A0A4Z0C6D8_9BURK|nr:hypothetical protein [Ramlibacter henchirensis]TFZ05625.1 hypothetical protein EZ313_02890 [Ramlibacter henchirensis]
MMFDFDLARMGVVYFHLLACCIAIGTVFMSDLRMVRSLLRADEVTVEQDHLEGLQTVVSRALLALWITGAMLVGMDVWAKGAPVLLNPKLQAKIAIVVLLTLNGFALHRIVLPALQRVTCMLHLAPSMRQFAVLAGAVSGVSWLYAAALGVGRPLNWKYSLTEIVMAYPAFIACGFMGMTLLMTWCSYRRQAIGVRAAG